MENENKNIALLGSIDIHQEIGTKRELIEFGVSLFERRGLGESFSPYENLVIDRYNSTRNLGQYGSSREMIQAHDLLRTRTVNVFDELRAVNDEFTLFAHLGERPSTKLHVIDKFSFATPECARSSIELRGIIAGNMFDFDNGCVEYKSNPILLSILQDGGTVLTAKETKELYNNNVSQSDFILFSSSGNNETSLMKDIETLRRCTGSSLPEYDFELLVALDSMSDTAQRVAIHYAATGTTCFLVNWSSRNYDMGYGCKKEMFTSPSGIATVSFLNHTNHIMKKGLLRCGEVEVNRLASEHVALAQQFNGILLTNGSIVNAEEGMASWTLRKAGYLGGPNEIERKLEAEAWAKICKEMTSNQSKGTARYRELALSTDLSKEEILDKIAIEFDTATKNYVASMVDRSEAYVEYKMRKLANTNLSDKDIFTGMKMMNKFKKGSIKWVESIVLNSKVKQLASAKRSDKPLSAEMEKMEEELETVYTKQGLADKLKRIGDEYSVRILASAKRSGKPLSAEMEKMEEELETVYTKKLEEMVENRQAGWDRATDLNRYASAIRSGDPLSPEMKKLQAELETHYGGKKALDAKVKKVNAGKDKAINTKTKQVHDRNVNELGMIEANSEETVIQQCPNCKKEKNTTHIFIEEGGERKIVLDQCFSRSNGLTKQCDHTMKVKPSNKKTPSTISRRTLIRRKDASVVSSSDEPSSSGVETDSLGDYETSDEDDGYDTDDLCQSSTGSDDSDDLSISDESSSSVVDDDNRESRVFTFAPLFSISSESVIDPEAGMRVAMRFNNGLHYSGTIINVHPTHPTEPDVGLTVSIWLDDNTMETYVKYPSDDIRFLRNSSLSIAFDRKLFPLDIEE